MMRVGQIFAHFAVGILIVAQFAVAGDYRGDFLCKKYAIAIKG